MGFGTGLNALLTQKVARQWPDVTFHYRSFEQFPLQQELVDGLNYPKLLEVPASQLQALHAAEWGVITRLSDNFSFCKYETAFPNASAPLVEAGWANLIYYDAFAPASQPELWGPEAMAECYRLLAEAGCLVTYCAKGQFKRDLKSVGFRVECPAGPPGKREMTWGVK